MPDMRCLAIGVSDAPPLEFLRGAANGARAFGTWAQSLGTRTEVLTDEEKPVGCTELRAAFERLLSGRQGVDWLLVYFGGHGLSRGAGEDLWLPSAWHADQRAISINALRRRLSRYAVRRLTIVGDACRSLPADADSADLVADAVLGRGPFDPTEPRLDLLQASSPYHASYMVLGARPEDDRCIFSGVLEEALSGAREEAFDARRGCITSVSLAGFLEREVPLRAVQYLVKLEPHVVSGFREPDDVYLAARPVPPPSLRPWPTAAAVGAMGSERAARGAERGWSTRDATGRHDRAASRDVADLLRGLEGMDEAISGGRAPRDRGPGPIRDGIGGADRTARSRSAARIRSFRMAYRHESARPTGFETGSGFSLDGAAAQGAVLGRHGSAADQGGRRWWRAEPGDAGMDGNPWWRLGRLMAPLPLLIELDDGTWCGAAALPGFIGAFTVADGGVASLIYRPVHRPDAARETETAVAWLRAGALTAPAAYGLAARLRDDKESDPVRSVLAAYLYDTQGDAESVHRTAWSMARHGLPIPFDIAVLGRMPAARDADGLLSVTIPATRSRAPRSAAERIRPWTHGETGEMSAPVAGAFPWLRQGWTLLEDEAPSPLVPDALVRVAEHVRPFPFTTLSAEGGRQLRAIVGRL